MLSLNSKSSSKITRHKVILLGIIFVAFLLRVNNLTIGFPILFISNDEAIYHQSALNMLAQKTPFTLGNYGPLGSYIQLPFLILAFAVLFLGGKVASVSEMEFLLTTQEGYMLFIPRIISAMFGTLSVLACFWLSREIFKSNKAALLSSAIFAVSFNLVHVSHLARAWSGAIFFSLLAAYFAVRSIKWPKNEIRNSIFGYLAAAVTFGFHQVAGMIIILVILIRLLGKKTRSLSLKIDFWCLGFWFLLVLIFNYLSLGPDFLSVLNPLNTRVGLTRFPFNRENIFDFNYFISNIALSFPRDLILTDGLVILLAILFFFKKQNRQEVLAAFLIFISINFLLCVFIFYPLLRYFLMAFAFLPVFAGYLMYSFLQNKTPVLAILMLGVISFNSLYWNFLILQEPTFTQVKKWIDNNIAPEIPMVSTLRRNVGYVPVADASLPIRSFKPGYYLRAARLVGNSYPDNVRNIVYAEDFGTNNSKVDNLKKVMKVFPVEYVVDSYTQNKDRMINQNQDFNLELVAHFSPSGDIISDDSIPQLLFDASYVFPLFRIDRAGPYFDVLRVKY